MAKLLQIDTLLELPENAASPRGHAIKDTVNEALRWATLRPNRRVAVLLGGATRLLAGATRQRTTARVSPRSVVVGSVIDADNRDGLCRVVDSVTDAIVAPTRGVVTFEVELERSASAMRVSASDP